MAGRALVRHRQRVLLAVLLATAVAACEDPLAPPIAPEVFRLDVLSRFEQVLGQRERGFVEFAVAVPSDVPPHDLARIEAMDVTWPIGAIISPIPLEFTPVDDELRAGTRVVRDRGLTQGSYVLAVRFDDGQVLTVEQAFMSGILGRPTILSVAATQTDVTLEWRTPPQIHDWRLSLLRTDGDAVQVLGATSGRSTISAQVGASFAFEPDPDGSYAAVLVMESPYNYRELTVPVQAP